MEAPQVFFKAGPHTRAILLDKVDQNSLICIFTCGGAVRSMDCTQNFGSGTLVIGRVGLIVSFEELDTVNVKSRIQ